MENVFGKKKNIIRMTRIKKIGIRGIRISFVDSDYNYMFKKEKILRTLNKKIPQAYAVLILVLFGFLLAVFLIYQYWKIYQMFE